MCAASRPTTTATRSARRARSSRHHPGGRRSACTGQSRTITHRRSRHRRPMASKSPPAPRRSPAPGPRFVRPLPDPSLGSSLGGDVRQIREMQPVPTRRVRPSDSDIADAGIPPSMDRANCGGDRPPLAEGAAALSVRRVCRHEHFQLEAHAAPSPRRHQHHTEG